MKLNALAPLGLFLSLSLTAAEPPLVLSTDNDKASYSIGMDIGRSFKLQGIEVNTEALTRGFKDAFTGQKTLLTTEQAQQAIEAFKKQMTEKHQANQKLTGDKNQKEGEAFLAENKKKEGVKTLPSGLQYKVLRAGTGKTPKATDTVKAHYRGTLIDGTEFDSSYKGNEPLTFALTGVVPGWTEALQLMAVGSKWQLCIPAKLAYGESGYGPAIGPNATLLFDIELLSIENTAAK